MAKTQKYDPDIEVLMQYYQDKEIVGEESVYVLATLGLLAGNSFSIEGRSGSGKTKIAESLRELLPAESVYLFDASSDKAIIRDNERVNRSKILYVPEMQNALNKNYKTTIEMLKCLCEGRDFRYPVSIGGKQVEFTIRGDITFCTTLATENEFERKVEYTRRMFQLFTRMDGDIKKKLRKEKARRRYVPSSDLEQLSEQSMNELKKHAKSVLYMPDIRVVNVFSDYIDSLIPEENGMVDTFIDKYYDLNDASGKFHYPNRIMKKINGEPTLFINLDDVKLIHDLYPPHFFKSLLELDSNHSSEEDTIARFNQEVDWQRCVESGIMRMKEYYPSIADSWLKIQDLDGMQADDVNDKDNLMDFDEWEKKFGYPLQDQVSTRRDFPRQKKRDRDYQFRLRFRKPVL